MCQYENKSSRYKSPRQNHSGREELAPLCISKHAALNRAKCDLKSVKTSLTYTPTEPYNWEHLLYIPQTKAHENRNWFRVYQVWKNEESNSRVRFYQWHYFLA